MKIKQLDEKINHYVLDNGLNVFIYDDENISEYNANYTTLFGSNDLEYKINNKSVNLPHGIAHFLEHVMFASEEGDLFNKFSDLGASANAYTSYNQTSYVFSTATNILENLQVLTELVQTRYFTNEVVAKEMGIITEEIIMYDQMPEWRLRNLMYEAVCQNTNYKIDIAGTVETINKITPNLLEEIFDLFYVPVNQVLTISGNFKGIDIVSYLNEIQILPNKEFNVEVSAQKEVLIADIVTKQVHFMSGNKIDRQVIAYKFEVIDDSRLNIENYFSLAAFQKAYFSNLNPEYNLAKENDEINDNLGASIAVSPDLSLMYFSILGNEYLEKSSKFVENTMNFEKIDKNMLKYGLRRLLASEIRATDNKADFVESVITCKLDNLSLIDYYDVLFDLNEDKIMKNLHQLFVNAQKFDVIMNKE